MIRSGNPALKADTFTKVPAIGTTEVMTIQGTVNKTALCLLILMMTAAYVWNLFIQGEQNDRLVTGLMWLGLLGGLVVAFVTIFKNTWAPLLTPLYAALEGLSIGGISAYLEQQFPGIVIQAVGGTFGVLLALLLAYKSGLIRATENFKLGVTAATGGICFVYLLGIVLRFFGIGIPYIHESGPIGIGFSVFVVVIAALNLVMDFDFIEEGANRGAPKYMEWYGAFGLLVTLIWLYLEILRLLAKTRSRD